MGYDLTGIKRKLTSRYPWFGGIIADTGFEETDKVRTLAGDGKTIRYNPAYLEELTKEEQLFVFAHELCHIAFDHIYRSAGKDQEVWKAATDAVVNQWLKRDGLPIARGGIREEPSEQAMIAACLVLEGADTVGESLYFVNPDYADAGWFDRALEKTAQNGSHIFYSERGE